MITFRVQDWEIEVDATETARFQSRHLSGTPEECGCLHCKNFVATRHAAYPTEFLGLLKRLGVPADHESEIFHGAEIEPGVHLYGGWFHFVGVILGGPEAYVGKPTVGPIKLQRPERRLE